MNYVKSILNRFRSSGKKSVGVAKTGYSETIKNKYIECGDCCTWIGIRKPLDQLADECGPSADIDFMLKHWTSTKLPPVDVNPVVLAMRTKYKNWYKCDLYDSETRKCKDFENRPKLCRGCPGCVLGDKYRIRKRK